MEEQGRWFEKAGEMPTGKDSRGQERGLHRKWKRGVARNKEERKKSSAVTT